MKCLVLAIVLSVSVFAGSGRQVVYQETGRGDWCVMHEVTTVGDREMHITVTPKDVTRELRAKDGISWLTSNNGPKIGFARAYDSPADVLWVGSDPRKPPHETDVVRVEVSPDSDGDGWPERMTVWHADIGIIADCVVISSVAVDDWELTPDQIGVIVSPNVMHHRGSFDIELKGWDGTELIDVSTWHERSRKGEFSQYRAAIDEATREIDQQPSGQRGTVGNSCFVSSDGCGVLSIVDQTICEGPTRACTICALFGDGCPKAFTLHGGATYDLWYPGPPYNWYCYFLTWVDCYYERPCVPFSPTPSFCEFSAECTGPAGCCPNAIVGPGEGWWVKTGAWVKREPEEICSGS